VAVTAGHLAYLLQQQQGRAQEALPFAQQAADVLVAVHGREHPSSAAGKSGGVQCRLAACTWFCTSHGSADGFPSGCVGCKLPMPQCPAGGICALQKTAWQTQFPASPMYPNHAPAAMANLGAALQSCGRLREAHTKLQVRSCVDSTTQHSAKLSRACGLVADSHQAPLYPMAAPPLVEHFSSVLMLGWLVCTARRRPWMYCL
jgi:hypothetical protein